MMTEYWRTAATLTCTITVVIGVQTVPLPAAFPLYETVEQLRRTAIKRGLNDESRANETAGYYEDLINRSSVTAPNPFILWWQRATDDNKAVLEVVQEHTTAFHEYGKFFRLYKSKPNLDLADPRFEHYRVVNNSFGLADREYAVERAPNTRRMVFLGDSIVRGLGTPNDQTFSAQLEDQLNRAHLSTNVRRYELLNMAESGYRITQILDLTLEDAFQFRPDVYVVALSELSINQKWSVHLSQLVDDGVDLKYDFLRDVVRQANLEPGENSATRQAKLSRFMIPTVQWSLREIRKKARSHGAEVVVLLIPNLRESGFLDLAFRPVRTVLREEQIPTIDLLASFDEAPFRVIDAGDGMHPSAAGHRLIYSKLYSRIVSEPSLRSLFFGNEGGS
jgi:lysophospholipase L1-like esterase